MSPVWASVPNLLIVLTIDISKRIAITKSKHNSILILSNSYSRVQFSMKRTDILIIHSYYMFHSSGLTNKLVCESLKCNIPTQVNPQI